MNKAEIKSWAEELVMANVPSDTLQEPRVFHQELTVEWSPELLRTMVTCDIVIMERSPDIVVFFDQAGNIRGWRDDGREGTEEPFRIDPDALRQQVIFELGLSPETRLGSMHTVELPPVGWTHEMVLFCEPDPQPAPVVRVWVNPRTLKVIQCLYEGGKDQP